VTTRKVVRKVKRGRDRILVLDGPDGIFRLKHQRRIRSEYPGGPASDDWALMPPLSSFFADADAAEAEARRLLATFTSSTLDADEAAVDGGSRVRPIFAFAGALIGIVTGFVGWAPARTINERTYVSIGLGLLVGATLGWLLASWIGSRLARRRTRAEKPR
jgi:hypothetical protein